MDLRSSLDRLREGRGLPGFSALTIGFMLLVILEGAVVRATGSGAGCGQHWPLCNGEILPHHPRVATVIEFAHRSLTGLCTTLVLALTAWTFLAKPRGHRARKAALLTVFFLLTEGALGAVLVLGGYVERNTSNARVLVQSVHFTNTMLLLAVMTLTWWWNRIPSANANPNAGAGTNAGAPHLAFRDVGSQDAKLLIFALLAALLTGAAGSVAALADTLFPSPSLAAGLAADFSPTAPLLIHMRWMHPAAALLSVATTLWLCRKLPRMAAAWLLGLTLLQVVLGLADVVLLAPITLQVLHLLGADLFWIALVVISSEALARQPAHLSEPAFARGPLAAR